MLRTLLVMLAASVLALPARAQEPQPVQPPVTEIFKCKGRDGHWTYTNDRREAEKQKCEVVTRQINVAPAPPPKPVAPAAKSARPSEFPKETPTERASARERQ